MRVEATGVLKDWLERSGYVSLLAAPLEVDDQEYHRLYLACLDSHPGYDEETRRAWAIYSALTRNRTSQAAPGPPVGADSELVPALLEHLRRWGLDRKWVWLWRIAVALLLLGLLAVRGFSQGPFIEFQDEGVRIKLWPPAGIARINCVGAGVACSFAAGKVVLNVSGVAGSDHNLLSATHPDTVVASPVLGDVLYGNATPAWMKLAGNITTQKKALTQVGTGAVSAVPAWEQVAYADLSGVPSTFAPSAHNILSSAHGDSTAASAVRGDGIFAIGASPRWERVAHSAAAGGYWKWNGTDVVASTGAASGTGACAANSWASTLNADAAPACTQPGFSNLSGAATDAQIPNNITVDLATLATTATTANAGDSVTDFFPTGTAAVTANNLSAFAATTSLQLAGVLSDESGSGAVMYTTGATNVTLDVEGAGNAVTTVHFISFEGICQNTTASFSLDTPTANAPAAACITGSNVVNRGVLNFDPTTDETVYGSFLLPSDWTGNIDLSVEASAAEAGANVARLGIAGICVADGETFDPAFNAAQTFAWTNTGSGQRVTATQTALTATGCAAGERYFFKFFRDADGTSGPDSLGVDLSVIAVRFKYRRAQ